MLSSDLLPLLTDLRQLLGDLNSMLLFVYVVVIGLYGLVASSMHKNSHGSETVAGHKTVIYLLFIPVELVMFLVTCIYSMRLAGEYAFLYDLDAVLEAAKNHRVLTTTIVSLMACSALYVIEMTVVRVYNMRIQLLVHHIAFMLLGTVSLITVQRTTNPQLALINYICLSVMMGHAGIDFIMHLALLMHRVHTTYPHWLPKKPALFMRVEMVLLHLSVWPVLLFRLVLLVLVAGCIIRYLLEGNLDTYSTMWSSVYMLAVTVFTIVQVVGSVVFKHIIEAHHTNAYSQQQLQ